MSSIETITARLTELRQLRKQMLSDLLGGNVAAFNPDTFADAGKEIPELEDQLAAARLEVVETDERNAAIRLLKLRQEFDALLPALTQHEHAVQEIRYEMRREEVASKGRRNGAQLAIIEMQRRVGQIRSRITDTISAMMATKLIVSEDADRLSAGIVDAIRYAMPAPLTQQDLEALQKEAEHAFYLAMLSDGSDDV
jgi:hypothetical protein